METWNGSGVQTDDTTYTLDALDRVVTEVETHSMNATPKKRTTSFAYMGLTGLVTKETFSDTRASDSKTYTYDVYGHRISMVDDPTGAPAPKTYTYGYDVHGSVSTLLDDASGTVKATYGYDAYGGKDTTLSAGDDVAPNDSNDPLNAYRYSGRRLDTGSGTIDMGARRFGPDSMSFLQPDSYAGALAHLGLSMDPLTGNRYALAAGNPVSYVEVDGHVVADVGPAKAPDGPPAGDDRLADVGPAAALDQGLIGDTVIGRLAASAENLVSSLPPFKQIDDSFDPNHAINTPSRGDDVVAAANALSWVFTAGAVLRGIRTAASVVRAIATASGRGVARTAGGKAVGFAPGEAAKALTSGRIQHATRHLIDEGLLPAWKGTTSPTLIRQTLSHVLEQPLGTANAVTHAGTRVKIFLGELSGRKVAVSIFKEGQYQGEIATAFVPTATQLAKWGL